MSLYKNKKVVVTGGSGFVGTNMVLELLNRGANVRTSTHKRPMQIQDDRIELLENILDYFVKTEEFHRAKFIKDAIEKCYDILKKSKHVIVDIENILRSNIERKTPLPL